MQRLRALTSFIGATLAALGLAGCATSSSDGGIGAVRTLTQERLGSTLVLPAKGSDAAQAAAVDALLGQPLTAEAAVQVALLNNRGLRASLAGLEIADADLVQAGRLVNPRFTFGNKRSSEAFTIDRTVLFNVMALIARPLAQEVAARQSGMAQLQVAADVLQLAGETRRAWVLAVGLQESVEYFEQVKLAADIGAELAVRMVNAGNFSKLARMREQAFQADATAQLVRAKQAAGIAREQMSRLLGVAHPESLRLPARLPQLPAGPIEPVDAERIAMEHRVDVQIARRSAEALARNLGLTRATRFINVLEFGYANESAAGERRQNGYEIEVELPIFDWGDARLARSEATYMQSVHRAANVATTARSEVRERYQRYRAAYDLARQYRDEIVPLRKRIAEENLLRYNGMLIGVFDLLADAREQVATVNASIEALRDFWLADNELQLGLSGTSGSPGSLPPIAMPPGAAAAPH